jgi:hypothetical protein
VTQVEMRESYNGRGGENMSNMQINVSLPNGNSVELNGDLSAEQIREILTAAGVANLAGAPVRETVSNGTRNVAFQQPTGTTKG